MERRVQKIGSALEIDLVYAKKSYYGCDILRR